MKVDLSLLPSDLGMRDGVKVHSQEADFETVAFLHHSKAGGEPVPMIDRINGVVLVPHTFATCSVQIGTSCNLSRAVLDTSEAPSTCESDGIRSEICLTCSCVTSSHGSAMLP